MALNIDEMLAKARGVSQTQEPDMLDSMIQNARQSIQPTPVQTKPEVPLQMFQMYDINAPKPDPTLTYQSADYQPAGEFSVAPEPGNIGNKIAQSITQYGINAVNNYDDMIAAARLANDSAEANSDANYGYAPQVLAKAERKFIDETVKPAVYPLAMAGAPIAGAIAAPLFLSDITRSLREKAKDTGSITESVGGTIADFTPFLRMGQEIYKDPAAYWQQAQEMPGEKLYEFGMNALATYMIGRGFIPKKGETIPDLYKRAVEEGTLTPEDIQAANIILRKPSGYKDIAGIPIMNESIATKGTMPLSDVVGNKKHMIDPTKAELDSAILHTLKKTAEQKFWEKQELPPEPVVEAKPVSNALVVSKDTVPVAQNIEATKTDFIKQREIEAEKLRKSSPATMDAYEKIQDAIDAMEDSLSKKYGEDIVIKTPIDPKHSEIVWGVKTETKMTPAEIEARRRLYDVRDAIGYNIDNGNVNIVLKRLPEYGAGDRYTASQKSVISAIKEIQESFASDQRWDRNISAPEKYKEFVNKIYTKLSHEMPDFPDALRGDIEAAIQVAREWPNTQYGINPKSLLEQSRTIADAIFKPIETTDGTLYGGLSGLDKLTEKIGFRGAVPKPEKGSVRAGVSLASDVNKGAVERGKEAAKQLYTDIANRFSPIESEVARFEKETGIKVTPEINPYDRAQVAHTSSARAEMLVSDKAADAMPALRNHYNIPHDVTLKSVVDLLPKSLNERLQKQNFPNIESAFDGYLASKRQLELQKNNPEYVGPIEPAKAARFIAENAKDFEKAAQDFYKYNDNLLQIGVDEGLIPKEVAAAIREKYKNYASMSRDFSDVSAMEEFYGTGKGLVNVKGVLKRIGEGSDRPVISPLESAVKNTYVVLSRVERNRVAQSIADLADMSEGGYFGRKTTESVSPDKSIFSVMRNGERVNYQTTPELYRALTSMNEEGIQTIAKILSYPAHWLRAGATLDPGFFAKNVSRDAFTASIYSKYGFIPVIDTIRGVASLIGDKKLYNEFKASGAPMSVITGMDRNSLSKAISGLRGEEIWANYNPIELLRSLTGFFENATRIREFEMAKKAGEGVVGQTRAAQDVTLNFSQRGAKTQSANAVTAFFNAQIQGVDKMVRAHMENPGRTAGRAALFITAPSVGLWLMNHDDIRYQELPAYQRDLFWIIPTGNKLTKERFDSLIKSGKTIEQILAEAGPMIRVPKPFELGIIYGSLPERYLDYVYSKNPEGMKKWVGSALGALKPNLIPTVATPILENITNHSFFADRPIVPRRQEQLPPKMQFGTRTTELAKSLGNAADKIIPGGVSPSKIDNAISGYLGGLGKTVIETGELMAQLREGRASKLLTEQPVLRSFFITPFRGAGSVQDFYEKYARQKELYEASKQSKVKEPDYDPKLYARLNTANNQIRELNKLAREAEINPRKSPDEKRKTLDGINIAILGITRNALKK